MSALALQPGRVELAHVVREHAGQLTGLSSTQQHVLRALADCRTAALGGHRRACAQCGHQDISHNSCRDRHCPKCQGLEAARWMNAWQQDLLPVPYFHVVFTVPEELHALFLAAPRGTYTRLFATVAETLAQVALRRLGVTIAVTAVTPPGSGPIPGPAAVANAVEDTLGSFGVVIRSLPITPEHVWRWLQAAEGSGT